MTTLADKAILSGADNRPPMLEKDMYDSWKIIMELYMMNRQHGRMILESVENGPLIWPTIEENGVTRPIKYSDLTPVDAIQADCDVKETNIILQGLPPEVYTLVSNHRIAKELWERIQLLMQGTSLTKQERVFHHNVYSPQPSIPQLEYAPTVNQQPQQPEFPQLDLGLTVPVFKQGDDPIDAINHMMSYLSAVVTSRYPTTNNQLRNSSNPRQQATINDGREELAFLADPRIAEGQATQTVITHIAAYQADSTLPKLLSWQIYLIMVQMLSIRHKPNNVDNNMINHGVQYVTELQQAAVQNSNSSAQQDALILSMIEQLKSQVINCTKINLDNKSVNDTLTAELKRYKEQVKVLKEGQNVDLKSKDNVSDSCEQSIEIDCLKQTLSEHLKENESLIQHAIVILDSKETLMLAEESRSKMLLKQQDLMVLEKKVNTTPVDYAVLNQLSQDFEK
ncbi:hypothetical protein Tco_0436451 [Tanacetum coccineum]